MTIAVEHVGHEAALGGCYLRGFVGTTSFARKDYRIEYDLGPALQERELLLSDNGMRK